MAARKNEERRRRCVEAFVEEERRYINGLKYLQSQYISSFQELVAAEDVLCEKDVALIFSNITDLIEPLETWCKTVCHPLGCCRQSCWWW